MICNRCGAENPETEKTCSRCGEALAYRPANLPRSGLSPGVAFYGGLYLVGAVFMIGVALAALTDGPSVLVFGSSRPVSASVAFLQAVLFGATGWAILENKRWAVTLVWVTTALSGIGVVFWGIMLADLFLWLVSFGFAIWYTRKTRSMARGSQMDGRPEVARLVVREQASTGSLRPETEPTPPRQVVASTQVEMQASVPPITSSPQAHTVEQPGPGTESGNLNSRVSPTRTRNLFKVAGVFAVILVAAFGCLLLVRPLIRYKYLKERALQFRYDRYSGRTDELVPAEGWVPVGFDRPPVSFPATAISLSQGSWQNGLDDPGEVCFQVENNSGFVVKGIVVAITIKGDPLEQSRPAGYDAPLITLHLQGDGLLGVGKAGRFCGTTHNWGSGQSWTYDVFSAEGWKQ
jgi:zinc-ribbon domain